ncbi:DASS family sodium-coupled anion symporter [Sphingobacterium sp. UT-1RO-CII-1]|uniref:SLC13 family permease n=1 Tax=Sphingobacterium sp. UT-1RO-CII-1 TaxID=2995225 RepID=UPI00227D653B|nr:DASS family sodium-coupled anion symporter [Sphingobacterium sp. UT-1RO-CII-1]MCY4778763.1 DASS family sodium-coupled anion symporter [Sphingobacterium sp. UT-1RO-CII-1]
MGKKGIHVLIGPLLFFIVYNVPIAGLSEEGQAVLASTLWIAYWWIAEALDLAITSLLPIIIFPLSGALRIEDVTASYGHPFIYLFMGGFILGLAIQKWNLHKRIAFSIIRLTGTSEKMVILGFLLATAFLSMWLSNTATAIMLLPIGTSVIEHFKNRQPFSKNLMLSVAYGASIGGMSTLIGSPPNIILAGIVQSSLGIEITFVGWMLFAFPLSCVLLFITWLYLTHYKEDKLALNKLLVIEPLPPISEAEKRVLYVFLFVAFMWVTRSFIWVKFVPKLDDTIIAITGALLLFLIPSGRSARERLMNWEVAKSLPWGVLLIFGAGLAIANGFSATDLTVWIGESLNGARILPSFLFVLVVIASINFLTEITSNTATASMMLPVLIALGTVLELDVIALLVGATLACSCAFMLPVATPPNAIVFSSGYLNLKDMMRTGFWLNIISIIVIYLFVSFAGSWLIV